MLNCGRAVPKAVVYPPEPADATIKVLLEAGADINHKGNDGRTPLTSARATNQEAGAQTLVQAGATM